MFYNIYSTTKLMDGLNASLRDLETLRRTAPFSKVKLKRPVLQARQGLIFILSLASLVAAHVMYLQPVVDNMQRTADALCAGKTNFTSFQDAAGLVFILDGDTLSAGGVEPFGGPIFFCLPFIDIYTWCTLNMGIPMVYQWYTYNILYIIYWAESGFIFGC